jgi:protein TonB
MTSRVAIVLFSLVSWTIALAAEHITVAIDQAGLYYPTPEYPLEARRQHMTGTGIFVLEVDAPSGVVTRVRVVRSTGFPMLDKSAVTTLKRWRFRPNTVAKIRIPITFSM